MRNRRRYWKWLLIVAGALAISYSGLMYLAFRLYRLPTSNILGAAAALWLIAVLIVWMRWRDARSAGIDRHTPACSRCMYPFHGWRSVVCPECGLNAGQTGIRVAMRPPRAVIAAAVIISIVLLGGHGMLSAYGCMLTHIIANAPLVATKQQGTVLWQSRYSGNLYAILEVDSDWQLYPPQHDYKLTMHVVRYDSGLPPIAGTGMLNLNPAPTAQCILVFTQESAPPDVPIFENAIAEVTPRMRDRERAIVAQNLHDQLTAILSELQSRPRVFRSETIDPANGTIWRRRGVAIGGSWEPDLTAMIRLNQVLPLFVIALPLLTALIAAQLVDKCLPTGIRPLTADERQRLDSEP
jgi:hypothetical protein